MKSLLTCIFSAIGMICLGQSKNVIGTFSNYRSLPSLTVTFNADSTFAYRSFINPFGEINEKGIWTMKSDTIILNGNLPKKIFSSSTLIEEKTTNNSKIELVFNHIRQYFNSRGELVKLDTLQIERLDFAFNENVRKNRTRIAVRPTVRCAFAGYIPKEIITNEKIVTVEKPVTKLSKIYIGCYELNGTKEFMINDQNANKLTLNVFSNHYEDGQVRQVKYLFRNDNSIFIKQKENGKFQKDGFYATEIVIIREKSGI